MALGYPNLPLMLSHIQVFALADLFTWNVLLNLVLSVEILPILPDPTMNTTFLMKPCQISLNLVIFLFKGISSGLHSSLVAFVMFTLDPGSFMLLEEQHTHTHTHTHTALSSAIYQGQLQDGNQEIWNLVPEQPLCNLGQVLFIHA